MTDREKAERIVECVRVFRDGCTMVGPHSINPDSDPADCEECVETFLQAVSFAMEGKEFPVPDAWLEADIT